jgi:DNA-binding LacI/PurR family transcriptional regulator
VNYVDVDNVGGARMAVEHLIRLGHTRIATITGALGMTIRVHKVHARGAIG